MLAALVGAMAPTLLDRSRVQLWPVFGVDHATGALAVALVTAVIDRAIAGKRRDPTLVLELWDLVALYAPLSYISVAIVSLDGAGGWALVQALVEGPLLLVGSAALWRKTRVRRLPGFVAGAHALIMAGSRALTAGTVTELAAVVGLMLAAGAVISAALAKHARRARVTALRASAAQTTDRQPAVPPLRSAPSEQTSLPDENRPS